MTQSVVIRDRFRGPPDSGNGGYVAGLLARHLDGPAEVTLRQPPPLNRPLALTSTDSGVALHDGDCLVAEARPADVDIAVPPPPDFEQATAAIPGFSGFTTHAFPGCFVCGPHRSEGDGLRIFPGPVGAGELVASPWVPDASLADETGRVAPEFLWAALDCPGGFSFLEAGSPPFVLGRLAVRVAHAVAPGERCVVTGWLIREEGRKRYTGSALFGETGQLCGVGRAIWIQLKS